jgi:hypothetical protein
MKRVYDEKLNTWFDEPECVDEWLELMWDIGCDYDGYASVRGLKYLIDELVEMSKEARKCLRENKLFPSEASYQQVKRSDVDDKSTSN